MPAILSLKSKNVPLSLQAFKAKIKLVDTNLIELITPQNVEPWGAAAATETDPRRTAAATESAAKTGSRDGKSPKPHAAFVTIEGEVCQGVDSWPDSKGRAGAIGRWFALVARDVGKSYTTTPERDAAIAFVQLHRLSIANAFSRRIIRADVVAELARLYRLSAGVDHEV